jgi:hypothetical protein
MTDPAADVRGIAAHLDVPLGPGEAEAIAGRYSLEANKQRTEAIAEGFRRRGLDLTDSRNATLSDADTQLHWNHIRKGEVGGWRAQARPDDIPLLAAECGGWVVANGYETDPLWAAAAREARRAEEAELHLAGARIHTERLTAAHAEATRLIGAHAAAHAEATRLIDTYAAAQADAVRHTAVFAAALTDTQRELAAAREDAAELRRANEELLRANEALRRTLEGGLACLPYRVVRRAKTLLNGRAA